MKTSFHGYYPPSLEQYERLWKEGLIVLDTNVLLNLYRLPSTARDELISVLELLKERLWVPHQVALEFQRRRLTVIASERKATEDALAATSQFVDDIKERVDTLQIDKRGLGIKSQPLLDELTKANDQLVDAIKTTHNFQLDISSSDPVRERLDELLMNRVGVGPTNQEELDTLVASGEDRFKEKIPPGFADAEKDKNPNEASFIFDHIKYQRKFGDLILWKQLIQHVKDSNIKTVLLVTGDRKEDWWWREQGKTIGPHPELIREIQREGSVNLFWMYSSVQFVEHANKYSTASVSNESVAEIKQVALSGPTSTAGMPIRQYMMNHILSRDDSTTTSFGRSYMSDRIAQNAVIEQCVARWLSRRGDTVETNPRGFPDLLVLDGEDTYGYDIKYIRHFDHRMILSPAIVNSLLRGYLETKEGRLSGFTLVIAIPEEDFSELAHSERPPEIQGRLERLLGKYPIDAIIVGTVIHNSFEILTYQKRQDFDEDRSF